MCHYCHIIVIINIEPIWYLSICNKIDVIYPRTVSGLPSPNLVSPIPGVFWQKSGVEIRLFNCENLAWTFLYSETHTVTGRNLKKSEIIFFTWMYDLNILTFLTFKTVVGCTGFKSLVCIICICRELIQKPWIGPVYPSKHNINWISFFTITFIRAENFMNPKIQFKVKVFVEMKWLNSIYMWFQHKVKYKKSDHKWMRLP